MLHGEVLPRKRRSWGVMHVMWSRDSEFDTSEAAFQPNHFVPLRMESSYFQLKEADFPSLPKATSFSKGQSELHPIKKVTKTEQLRKIDTTRRVYGSCNVCGSIMEHNRAQDWCSWLINH